MMIGDLTSMEKMEVFLHMLPKVTAREDYSTYMEIFPNSQILVRHITIPAGHVILGEVHKSFNVSILMSGSMIIMNEPLHGERVTIHGPAVFESAPRSQKFGMALTECVFMNVMVTREGESKEEAFQRMIFDTKELTWGE